MPSSRELAAALRVSRATVGRAYDQLIAEGYLDTQHGSGTFVCRDLPDIECWPPGWLAPKGVRARPRASRRSRPGSPRSCRACPRRRARSNLSTDGPTFDQFPFGVWKRLVRRHLQALGPSLFQYAPHGAGHPALRETIAAYLGRSRAVRCDASQVVIVSGSQQALDLCARVLIDPGDDVAVENPGYLGARAALRGSGARVHPVAVDGDGLVVAAAAGGGARSCTSRRRTSSHPGCRCRWRAGSSCWSGRARRGAIVVEDDYDSEYRYSGAPLPALQGLSAAAGVVYVGHVFERDVSGPAARLSGAAAGSRRAVRSAPSGWPTGTARSSNRPRSPTSSARATSNATSAACGASTNGGGRPFSTRSRARFGDRAPSLGDASGMHLVVRFDSSAVAARAARAGVHLVSTRPYYTGEAPPHEFIVRFTGLSERALREAVRRLGAGRS